jgi:hypothetical protein
MGHVHSTGQHRRSVPEQEGENAMPKPRNSQGRSSARSAGSSASASRVIEGGVRPLPIEVEDGSLPSVALWVDSQSGMVLAHAMIDRRSSPDEGASEALAALEQALQRPEVGAAAPVLFIPGAPQRSQAGSSIVVRTDRRLAALAQLRLARLHVVVEATDDLPLFEMAFEEMTASLADSFDEPYAWEIDEALLPSLYEAAAEYARREPWAFMLDHPPFAVLLGPQTPLAGVEALYGSVMGSGGEVFGVAYYLSLDEYRAAARAGTEMQATSQELQLDEEQMSQMVDQLRSMGAPVDSVPPDMLRDMLQDLAGNAAAVEPPKQEALVCFFESADDVPPSYLDWLEERGIEFEEDEAVPGFLRAGQQDNPRNPSAEEVRAFTIALDATNQFLAAHMRTLRRRSYTQPRLDLRHTAQVQDGGQELSVEVVWPAPGYDAAEDPAE